MEPLTIDRTHILVLNYNGRGWLEECLPSVREAAGRSPVPCPVSVVDNGSTDGSCDLVAERWPDVGLIREENLGLASFNGVLARMDEPVVLLLNNDIKLDPDAVGPLLEPFERSAMTPSSRPRCAGRSTAARTRGCGRGSAGDSAWCRGCAGCPGMRTSCGSRT